MIIPLLHIRHRACREYQFISIVLIYSPKVVGVDKIIIDEISFAYFQDMKGLYKAHPFSSPS